MYKPFVFKIPNGSSDFLNNENSKLIFSSSINQPLFSLGFHSFLHRTKSAMDITNKLESKNFYIIKNFFYFSRPVNIIKIIIMILKFNK